MSKILDIKYINHKNELKISSIKSIYDNDDFMLFITDEYYILVLFNDINSNDYHNDDIIDLTNTYINKYYLKLINSDECYSYSVQDSKLELVNGAELQLINGTIKMII